MFGVVQNDMEDEKRAHKKNHRQFRRPQLSVQWKKILVWGGVILLIVLLIVHYLYLNYYRNYNYIKEDVSQNLVYTSETFKNKQDLYNEIPYVNIDSDDARLVNETVQNYADSFLENENNLLVYNSQVNGKVLSIVLRMTEYSDDSSYPEVVFHTYNFNLDTQKLMNDDEVLSFFDVTKEDVEKKVEEQFKKYYEEEVYLGYFVEEECDYQCFLSWRGIDNYMDSLHYYIKNGKLIAYRCFSTYSVYGEEEYFTDEHFEIYIAG